MHLSQARPQPIPESALLTGPLEPTNEAYALAKIAGIVQVQSYRRQYGASYISAMPTNLYGPGDNFDLETSHVLPALIRRFHEAKRDGADEVTLWGSGSPRREFLHVDDLAAACVRLLEVYDDAEPVNVGCGEDLAIRQLAETVADVTEYQGRIVWDTTKPDGTPASSSTSPGSPRSASSRRFRCGTASPAPTPGGSAGRPRRTDRPAGRPRPVLFPCTRPPS